MRPLGDQVFRSETASSKVFCSNEHLDQFIQECIRARSVAADRMREHVDHDNLVADGKERLATLEGSLEWRAHTQARLDSALKLRASDDYDPKEAERQLTHSVTTN